MKRLRRRWVLPAVALAIIAASAALLLHARTYPQSLPYIFETRRFLLKLKADGHAPDVSWLALARRMGPRFVQGDAPLFVRPAAEGTEPCPVLWRTPLGDFWGARDDGHVLEHLVTEELGGHIYNRAPAGIRAGDTVVDVGAHLGTFTRYAMQHGAARVIAIEPMPDVAACFRRTFAPEIADGRVALAEVAAWDADTTLDFRIGAQSTVGRVSGAGDRGTARTIRVRAARLDTLMPELAIERVDFIKMDIEGAETPALRGAAGVIRADQPRMAICIYHGSQDPITVPEAVFAARSDYRVFYRSRFQAYFHR